MEDFKFSDVVDVFTDFYGEDRIDTREYTIIVHFPKVTVTNEDNESTDITHLFAKVEVEENGSYKGSFLMIRSEFSENQAYTGYIHSHLPSFAYPDQWESPCLGRGPIRNTLATLSDNPSEDMWKMFCLELDKYVQTESLAGGPYKYIRDISKLKKSPYNIGFIYGTMVDDYILDNFINYIIHKRPFDFNFDSSLYHIAEDETHLVIKLSNLYLEWCNSLSNEEWESKKTMLENALTKGIYENGIVQVLTNRYSNNRRILNCVGRRVLTFKGKEYKLSVIPSEQREDFSLNILKPDVYANILRKLLIIINFCNGNTTTCIPKATYKFF